jgi:hypothetical protein
MVANSLGPFKPGAPQVIAEPDMLDPHLRYFLPSSQLTNIVL